MGVLNQCPNAHCFTESVAKSLGKIHGGQDMDGDDDFLVPIFPNVCVAE